MQRRPRSLTTWFGSCTTGPARFPNGTGHVFEPACGHSPFLLSAMRLLRLEMQDRGEAQVHEFLKSHIHGVEIDDFAREIARLSLTLADVPNPNGWDLRDGDMYASDVLMREASKCRILLSNPPYEAFGKEAKRYYAQKSEVVTANTKATEMLLRTLPYLPPGGIFGVVVPLGVLHDKESKPVRERLLTDFDLSEISVFADNLFEHGDHEVAVLMGRRKKRRTKPIVLHYRRVREQGMEAFKDRLAFSWEREVSQSRFAGETRMQICSCPTWSRFGTTSGSRRSSEVLHTFSRVFSFSARRTWRAEKLFQVLGGRDG